MASSSSKRSTSLADNRVTEPPKKKTRRKENLTSPRGETSSHPPRLRTSSNTSRVERGDHVLELDVPESEGISHPRMGKRSSRRQLSSKAKPSRETVIDLTSPPQSPEKLHQVSVTRVESPPKLGDEAEPTSALATPHSKTAAKGNARALPTPPPTVIHVRSRVNTKVVSPSPATAPSARIFPRPVDDTGDCSEKSHPSREEYRQNVSSAVITDVVSPSALEPPQADDDLIINLSPHDLSEGRGDTVPSSQTQELHADIPREGRRISSPPERPPESSTFHRGSSTVVPTSQSQERELRILHKPWITRKSIETPRVTTSQLSEVDLTETFPRGAGIQTPLVERRDYSVASSQSQVENEIRIEYHPLPSIEASTAHNADNHKGAASEARRLNDLTPHGNVARVADPLTWPSQRTPGSPHRAQHPKSVIPSFSAQQSISSLTLHEYDATDDAEPLGQEDTSPRTVFLELTEETHRSPSSPFAVRHHPNLHSQRMILAPPPRPEGSSALGSRTSPPQHTHSSVHASYFPSNEDPVVKSDSTRGDLEYEAESQYRDSSEESSLPSVVWDFLEMFDETQAE
ncbi:hypothetical protein CERSUDRAFT_91163 [Gelatoporia subvermispora B]|uniref:Uncharacterized protein n=1 Tax=Ceriporiopsis subvermispora (strain B) TaxID=914234 RepID=M2RPT8_CERS8|nr:hypothetical protein CERSUDRAFT_91163 [Gelatoporia subvermispora B]